MNSVDPRSRRVGPLRWSREYCGGAWVASTYDDVVAVLRDPRLTTARAGAWVNVSGPEAREELRPLKNILARTLLFTEGARHRRLRMAMAPVFTRAGLASLEAAIRAQVDERIDELGRHGSATAEGTPVDFMERFARPLPAGVMAQLLGVDPADTAPLVQCSDEVAHFIGELAPTMAAARRAQDAAQRMVDHFRWLVRDVDGAGRRAGADPRPGGDLLAALLRARARGALGLRDLLAQCGMLLFAGHETTRNLLGNGLRLLLQSPESSRRLRAQPDGLRPAITEMLRFDSPVRYTGRRACADLSIGGQAISRGQLVIAMIDLANHDPARFSRPEEFRIDRDEAAPLSFGWGPHVCIGAELAHLEARVAFARILERMPSLRLAPQAFHWIDNPVYRGLARLLVHTGPVAAAPSGRVPEPGRDGRYGCGARAA
jgi:cytochrome P450